MIDEIADVVIYGHIHYNFLEKIVDFTKSITSEELSLSKMTILLPSRRSCNELKRLFLEKSDGAIILPKIIAIGDIDYDDLLLKSIQINEYFIN